MHQIHPNTKFSIAIGIPKKIIYIHQMIPDNIQESPLNNPPKINHNIFPNKLIIHSPFHKHQLISV